MATQTTGGGSTTSFGNAPQAQADSYTTTEDATNGIVGASYVILLDVMANDLGGNAKSLFSVDDGTQQSTTVVKSGDADLLTMDTQYADSSAGVTAALGAPAATSDHSALGARIWITADGKIAYDTATSQIEALQGGVTYKDTFDYAIQLGNGTLSWTTVTVYITGVNDMPVLSGLTTAPQAITELSGQTGSAAPDTASASFTFTDPDLADTHQVSIGPASAVWSGGASLPANLQTALNNAATATLAQDSTGGGTGKVNVAFSAADSTFDFLAAGQTLTVTYNVTVDDLHGGKPTQAVTFTVTGTNDAPVLAADASGPHAITEMAGQTGSPAPDLSSASLSFTDPDLTDLHSVTAGTPTFSWAGGSLSSAKTAALHAALDSALTTVVSTDSANGATGHITASFSAPDSTFDFLAAGQTLQVTYNLTVDDHKGGTSTRPVTFTVTGTNDAPVLRADNVAVHGMSEIAGVTAGSGTETATTTLGFTDVDLTDSHLVSYVQAGPATLSSGSIIPAGALSALASALTLTPTDSTGTGSGQVKIDFALADHLADFLAAGQTLTVTYDVTVADGSTSSTKPVTFTVTGTNDAPVLRADNVAVHGMSEIAGVTAGSGVESASTTLSFTDVDLTDSHTVSVSAATATWSGGSTLPAGLQGVLDGALSNAPTDSTNTGSGSVGLTFSAADSDFDFLAAGETLTAKYVVTVTDNNGASSHQTVTFAVHGANDAPVISLVGTDAASAGLTETNSGLASAGTLTVRDPDLSDHVDASVSHVGLAGVTGGLTVSDVQNMLTVTATDIAADPTDHNNLAWSFDSGSQAFDFLAQGEILTLTYTVTATDSQGASDSHDVTVTITGTNDAPLITSSAQAGAVTEDAAVDSSGNLNASGAVTFTDVDTADTHTASALQQGADATHLGLFTLDSSAVDTGNGGTVGWSFQLADGAADYLAEGQTLTQHYDVTVTDNHGATAVQTVTVTITGTNEAPQITSTAQAGAVTEDVAVDSSGNLNASGAVTFTDVDTADTHTASALQQGADATHLGLFTLDSSAVDTGNGGTVGWSFQLADGAADYLAEGQTLTQHYDVTVTDNHGATAVQTVTVTITGTNEAPQITSTAQAGAVTEDVAVDSSGNLNASGAVTFTDVDTADTHTASALQQGADATHLGLFTLDSSAVDTGNGGTVGWSFQLADGAADYLAEGQTLTQHYDVTVTDNHGATAVQTVTVTITGTNEAPQITSTAQAGAVTEDAAVDSSGNLNASGAVTFTDVDTADTHTASALQQGADATHLGLFTLDSSAVDTGNGGTVGWSFQLADGAADYLAEGQTLTQHYDVTVTDNHGATAVQTVTVTITGTNEAPQITSTAQAGAVTEDAAVDSSGNLNASGAVTFTDVDTADTHTASALQQGADATHLGLFTLDSSAVDTGNGGTVGWSFQLADGAADYLAEGQTLTQHYDVTVTDNHGATAVQTVTVTITGTNEAPQITSTAQAGAVTEDVAVDSSGNLNASGAVTFTDVDTADTHTASALQQGADATHLGLFTLDSSAVDTGNGGTVGWSFQLADGAADYLAEGQTLTQHYDVTVTDNHGATAVQTVTVTITGTNEAPQITSTAQAGAVTEDVAVDSSGNLNASGAVTFTDVDTADTHTASALQQGADATHLGLFTLDSSAVDTGNGGTVGWSFQLADGAADYLAEGQTLTQHYDVTVTDNHGATAVQTVTVTITGTNEAPQITSTAQAGAVTEDAAVDSSGNLNASGAVTFTDVDTADTHTASALQQGADATHLGLFTLDSSAVDTGNGGTVGWSFQLADGAADYLAEGQTLTQHYDVTVTDNHGATAVQTVTVTITGTNEAPQITSTAQAGAVTEDVAVDSSGNLNASGAVTFTDVDTADTHTASALQQGADATHLGLFTLDSSAVDTGNGGTVGWSFQLADGAADYLAEGQTLTQHYDVTVTDNHGATAVQTVTVTITGTNEAPQITSTAQAGAVTEDVAVDSSGNLNASGAVTFTDVDTADTHTASALQQGADATHLGLFTLDSSAVDTGNGGTVGWSFQLADGAADYLAEGQTLTQHYDVTVTDNHGATAVQTVTVTITGTNEAPQITSTAQAGAVTEDVAVDSSGNLNASGAVTFTDVDTADTHTASALQQGADATHLGLFTLDSSAIDSGNGGTVGWSFQLADGAADYLAEGQTLTQHYDVTVTDNHGATAVQTVTVTITGTNEAPTIVGAGTTATGAVVEDAVLPDSLHAAGTIAFTDVDLNDSHTASFAPAPGNTTTLGTFNVDANATEAAHAAGGTFGWTYDLDNSAAQSLAQGEQVQETYVVTVDDGNGGTVNQNVVVTITGTNDAPTLDAVTAGSVAEIPLTSDTTSSGLTGILNGADVDHGAVLTYGVTGGTDDGHGHIVLTDAHGSLSVDTGTGAYVYTPDSAAVEALAQGDTPSDSFTVTVTDEHNAQATQTFTVNLTGSNDAATITGTVSGQVQEDVAVSGTNTLDTAGTLVVHDVDHGQNLFQPVSHVAGASGLGFFSIDAAGAWTYSADNTQTAIQQLGQGQSITDSFTAVSSDGTASQLVTVTINGTNDIPVIGGVSTGSVTEDVAVSSGHIATSGVLTIADVDQGQSNFAAHATIAGTYGAFSLDAAGAWTYSADNTQTAVQQLGQGQSITDSFTAVSSDGTASQLVTVTINGTNDIPVIGGVSTGSVTEDVAVSSGHIATSGVLTIADVDQGQSNFAAHATIAGTYGAFSLDAAGAWTYSADNTQTAVQQLGQGQSITDSFTTVSSDGTASQLVTVTINGTNDIPVIGGVSTGSVTEDVAVSSGHIATSGVLTIADVDQGQSNFAAHATIAGTYGAFSLDAAGAWTYSADNTQTAIQQLGQGQSITDSFTAVSSDGTASQLVTVTINGTNDIPVIGGVSTGAVTEDVAVSSGHIATSGVLTIADVDQGQSNFTAQPTAAGTYGTFTLAADGHWTYSVSDGLTAVQQLGAGQHITDSFTAVSSDGTASQLVTVTINGTNDIPVIGGVSTGAVQEDVNVQAGNTLQTAGVLTIADVDQGQSNFTAQPTAAGTYGTFTLAADGHWTYSVSDGLTAVQQLGAGQHITDSFTAVSSDGTASQLVTVTINGTNDIPVIGGVSTGAVQEDVNVQAGNTLQTAGVLTIADVDQGQSNFTAQPTAAGTYGTFTLAADGHWTYSVSDGLTAVQQLGAGQHITDSFTAVSSDGTASQVVTVTINGTNDIPVIGGVSTGAVTEDVNVQAGNTLQTAGVLTIADVDQGQSSFTAQPTAAGTYGTFTLAADGHWTYSVNDSLTAVQQLGAGQSITDSFTANSLDGTGHQLVTVTINGTNDAPVLDASKTPVLTAENQNPGSPSGAVGTLVSSLVSLSGGVANVNDVDTGAVAGLALTGVDTTNGSWFYSTNGGTTWTAVGAVSNTSALLLAADANTRLYLQSNSTFSGTVANAITFRAWDTTSGTPGAKVTTATTGGSSAFSTATDTASITINPADTTPPTFAITSAQGNGSSPSILTLTFNETMQNFFDPSKLTLTGVKSIGTESWNSNFTVFTIEINKTGNNGSNYTADFAAGAFKDLAGNLSVAEANPGGLKPAGVSGQPVNLSLSNPQDAGSVTIHFTNLPTDWHLDGAIQQADGSWTINTTDPSSLTVTPSGSFVGAMVLDVQMSWVQADGSTATASIADNVEAYAVGSPIFALSSPDNLTGSAAADEFVFSRPIGADTIHAFDVAHDTIDLIGFAGFSSFADIQAHTANDANGNAVITLGAGETITLAGVDAGALTASDFLFNQEPTVTNTGTMTIGDSASLPLDGQVVNSGVIALTSTGSEVDLEILPSGVTLTGGGQVTLSDSSQNVIYGATAAVVLTNVDNTLSGAGQIGQGSLTLVNEGTIDATGTNALVIDTGSSTVVNSGLIEATGAGGLTVASALDNSGALVANGGDLHLMGAVTGSGAASLFGSSTIEFGAASSEAVTFDAAASATLKLDNSAAFTGVVSGFGAQDHIDLVDIATGATASYAANAEGLGGVLTVSDGARTATIALNGQYDPTGFHLADDHLGGALVGYWLV